jgi:hypothetical protein
LNLEIGKKCAAILISVFRFVSNFERLISNFLSPQCMSGWYNVPMEPFHQCLALGPVAIYLLLLGAINLSRRPLVVSGGRDAATLSLAMSGLIFVGPMALLFPESLAARFGPAGTKYLWLMFVGLFALCLILMLLNLRPRLVIYNVSMDQLRPILAEVVARLDLEVRWAGDCLYLPGLGIQFHMEGMGWMRNVSLVSAGPKQDYHGWSRLDAELTLALRGVETPWNVAGLLMLSIGNVLVIGLGLAIIHDPQAIARTVFELLT